MTKQWTTQDNDLSYLVNQTSLSEKIVSKSQLKAPQDIGSMRDNKIYEFFDLSASTSIIINNSKQSVLLESIIGSSKAGCAVDEPESWSVLKKTIPGILCLDNKIIDNLLVTIGNENIGNVMNLPEEDWMKLYAGAIYKDDQFEIIFFLSLGYLVELGISLQSLDIIASVIVEQFGCNNAAFHKDFINALSNIPIISESEVSFIRNLRIDSFIVNEDLLCNINTKTFVTWGDLIVLTERNLMETSKSFFMSIMMIKIVWQLKSFIKGAINEVFGFPSDCFESMMLAYMKLAAKIPRDKELLEGRMGILQNRKWTLEELATQFKITRERVRQIEEKLKNKLRSPKNKNRLAKFWVAIDEILRTSGGVCTMAEAVEQIAVKMEWTTKPSQIPFISLLQFNDHIYVDKQSELITNPLHNCYQCETIVFTLESLFIEDKSEQTINSTIEKLLTQCICEDKCAYFSNNLTMSEGFIRFVAQKTDGILVEDGVVYCQDTWSGKRGSRIQLVESILKNAGKPMHFSEVYCEVKRLLPEDKRVTEHNVHSWMGRNDNILLWDRGTFVHHDFVSVPLELIANVESWLLEKLKDEIPFISIAGAYNTFKYSCSASDIASESALYSCLRKSANPELCYPRYPQIYLSCNYKSQIPADIALEQYIKYAKAEVPYITLKEYALSELCLKDFQFQQYICRLSNILRTKTGGFIYSNSLDMGHINESLEDFIIDSINIAPDTELTEMITYIISAHYSNGFRINSPIELLRFRRFANEDFNCDISTNDDELAKYITSCGTFFDGKVYIIDNDIERQIQNTIDAEINAGARIIYYNSFYECHGEWLFPGRVISSEMLKDILIKLYPKYMHKSYYFSPKEENSTELVKIKNDIMRVWSNDVILKYEQLSERLPYIPIDKIKQVLSINDEFIWNTKEVYTHISKVDVTDDECIAITNYVEDSYRANGYASLSNVPLGEIEERNYELTLTAIHNAVFKIALIDKYDRRGKIMTRKGDILDAFTIIKEHCRSLDKCSLQELLDLERELTGESHRWIPMEAGYSVMVRADENNYIAEKYIYFDIARIDSILDIFVTDEYLPLKSITTFAAFPHCGQVWNLFLLESYCRRFSDKYRFDVLSTNSMNAGVIIRKSCNMSYFQIMTDAVAKSNIPIEKTAIMDFLFGSGYIGRRSYSKIDELIEQARSIREKRD